MRSPGLAEDAKQDSVYGDGRNDDRKPDYADGPGVSLATRPLKEISAGESGDITMSFRAGKVVDTPLTSEEEEEEQEEETRRRRGGGLVLHSKSAEPAVVKRSSSLALRSAAERKDSQNSQQLGWSDSE
jgi:hypothetical protein